MARILGGSFRTIETHRSRVMAEMAEMAEMAKMAKMAAKSLAELVRKRMDLGGRRLSASATS